MSDLILPDYDDFDFLLQTHKLPCSASELHGILSGAICAGMSEHSRDWIMIIRDFCLDGALLPDEVVTHLTEIYKITFAQLADGQLAYQPYLPEDDCALAERAEALVEWLTAFIATTGVQQINLQTADEEVRNAFEDFVSISQMDTDLDDDDESFESFEEIVEYVRMAAISCFCEFAAKPQDETKTTAEEAASNKKLFH